MYISPIQYNSNSYNYNKVQQHASNPSFTAWERTVHKELESFATSEIVHRNDTFFFRSNNFDLGYWDRLMDYIQDKYKNSKHINVYFYGCSDGSEVASFLMYAMKKLPKDFIDKMGTVRAVDYDLVAINKAKDNFYTINEPEIVNIREMLGDSVDRFFTNFPKGDVESANVRLSSEVTSKIKYKHANVLKDYANIKSENSIVFARNFWPYLSENMMPLAKKLGSQMHKNSLLTIGDFDVYGCEFHNFDIASALKSFGFKYSLLESTFEK